MEIVLAALLGLVSGFISAFSTGGGLVSLPGLLLLGVSPVSAIATSRFGAVSAALSSSIRYYRGRAIAWRYMPYFLVLAVVAGVIGPHILLNLDQKLVEKGIGVLLLALLPLVSYVQSGQVDFRLALPLALGALVGGYLGAQTALEKGSAWVKWLLVGVILLSSVKLLLQ